MSVGQHCNKQIGNFLRIHLLPLNEIGCIRLLHLIAEIMLQTWIRMYICLSLTSAAMSNEILHDVCCHTRDMFKPNSTRFLNRTYTALEVLSSSRTHVWQHWYMMNGALSWKTSVWKRAKQTTGICCLSELMSKVPNTAEFDDIWRKNWRNLRFDWSLMAIFTDTAITGCPGHDMRLKLRF